MLEAFWYGIQDGFLPVSLVRWLIFYGLLAYGANTRLKIVAYGSLFLAGTLLMGVLTGLGAFDKIFVSEQFGFFISGIVFLLGVGLTGLGVVGMRDRWRLKGASGRIFLRSPAFIGGAELHGWNFAFHPSIPRSWLGPIIWAIFGSLAGSFFSGFWQGDFVFQAYAFLLSQQDAPLILNLYGLYLLGELLPFIGVWVFVAAIHQSKSRALARVSLVKIVSAALFLSVGMGLFLNFFVNLNQM